MPLRFGRALALAGIGGVATYFCWIALGALFWGPFARYGPHVNDFDLAVLLGFGPFVVAAIFVMSISVAARFERKKFERGEPPPSNALRVLFLGTFPAAITFALINAPHPETWQFPLSETAVGLVGLALGYLWVRWRRTDEAGYSGARSPA